MEQTSSCGASEGGSGEAGAICAKVGGRRSVLLMSFWFGLVAGLLELLFLAIRVRLFEKGFFLRSRHFLWMVPLSDLLIFGVTGFLISLPWPRVGRLPLRVVVAVLLFLSLLCQLLLVRGLNSLACALFSAGVAFQASRWIAARPARVGPRDSMVGARAGDLACWAIRAGGRTRCAWPRIRVLRENVRGS